MMNPAKRRTLAVLPVLALALPVLETGAKAAPLQRTQSITATWVVTWLGIPAIRGRFRMQTRGGTYEAWFAAKSFGAFDSILKIRMNWYASGRVSGHTFRPARFLQNYRDRREKRKTHMFWRPGGKVETRLMPPESPGKRKKVAPALQRNTVDPLSAILAVSSQPINGRACHYTARIFEGRRRVNARLRLVRFGPTPIVFARGLPDRAYHCHLFADRIAGFRPRHMQRFPGKLPPADIWFVRMAKARLWIPVRIEFGTQYGRVRAFLTGVVINSP